MRKDPQWTPCSDLSSSTPWPGSDHDPTLFGPDAADVELASSSMGWTELAERGAAALPELHRLASAAADEGVTDIVLLGMGGSSLASLVLSSVLGESGDATVHVLDTTAPLTVDAAVVALYPASTFYIVASKSGGTVEPNALYAIFREVADQALGEAAAGQRFIAITDPGSSLEALAADDGFRTLVSSPATVGGRFSAMSVFGLVPAALAGLDVDVLLERALHMERACSLPTAENPAARLAAFVADAAADGKDKLTVVASPALSSIGLWIEQLVAESLGKHGRGVVPVVELSADRPQGYGSDRAVVVVRFEDDLRLAEWAAELAETHPVIELLLRDGYDVSAEFTRWEHAVALLGPLLGVNPFGQPNVQAAKDATNAALAGDLQTPAPHVETTEGATICFAGMLHAPGHRDLRWPAPWDTHLRRFVPTTISPSSRTCPTTTCCLHRSYRRCRGSRQSSPRRSRSSLAPATCTRPVSYIRAAPIPGSLCC